MQLIVYLLINNFGVIQVSFMQLINLVLSSVLECRVKSQFLSSDCKIPNPSHLVVTFLEISPLLQTIFLLNQPKIWNLLNGQIRWKKFPKLQWPNQLQKCPCQCLPFPNLLCSGYLKFWSETQDAGQYAQFTRLHLKSPSP